MAFSNTHFSISIHVLTTLASLGNPTISSTDLAANAGTNAAFLRHVVRSLKAAGLINSKGGNGGGIQLAKLPDQISVGDVYRAIEGTAQIAVHTCAPNSACSATSNFPQTMSEISRRVDSGITSELDQLTIADLVDA